MLKRVISMFIVVSLLSAILAVGAYAAVGDVVYSNVALGIKGTGIGNKIAGLTNGYDDTTYWNYSGASGEVVLDLKKEYNISEIKIIPRGAASNSDGLSLSVSATSDFSSSVEVGSTGEGITEPTSYTLSGSASYRYVKLTVGENKFSWSELQEIEVYAPFTEQEVPADRNVACGKPIFGPEDTTGEINKLVDGSTSTVWDYFVNPGTATVRIDLLAEYALTDVRLYFRSGGQASEKTKLAVSVSQDGSTWISLGDTNAADTTTTEMIFNTEENSEQKYRYIQVNQTTTGGGQYSYIQEIKAFVAEQLEPYNPNGNLAYQRPVTTNGGGAVTKIVDGNYESFAECFNRNEDGFFRIDLGNYYDLATVVVGFRIDNGVDYSSQSKNIAIYVTDKDSYTPMDRIATTPSTGVPYGEEIVVNFEDTKRAKYIWVVGPVSQMYYSLAEVVAYAKENTMVPEISAINDSEGSVVSVDVVGDAMLPQKGDIYIARFNASGDMLLDCRVIKNTVLSRANQTWTYTLEEPMAYESGDKFKAFVWSEDLAPLMASKEVTK